MIQEQAHALSPEVFYTEFDKMGLVGDAVPRCNSWNNFHDSFTKIYTRVC